MDIESLSSFFESRDFKAVAQILEQNPGFENDLDPEDFIETLTIAAFTYFNLAEYPKSLAYSGKLLDYFFFMSGSHDDEELIEGLVVIKYRSLCALGEKDRAYDLVKRAISKFGYIDEALEREFNEERDRRVSKVVSVAGYSLSVFAIGYAILQYFFKILHPLLSMISTGLMMLVLLALLKKEKGLFWKLLIKII
jgi:hypothetical protein